MSEASFNGFGLSEKEAWLADKLILKYRIILFPKTIDRTNKIHFLSAHKLIVILIIIVRVTSFV